MEKMKLKKCPQGHIYLSSNEQCPFCFAKSMKDFTRIDCVVYGPPPDFEEKLCVRLEHSLNLRNSINSYYLNEGETLLLGRDDTCDIVLKTYENVSHRHCCISMENGEVFVTDLGSMNGTYIYNRRIVPNQKTLLSDGDVLFLGNRRCIFRIHIKFERKMKDDNLL